MPVLRDDGGKGASSSDKLPTCSWAQLDVVDDRARRNTPQWKAVPWDDIGGFAGDDLVSRAQGQRGQDVAQDAILVLDEGHVRRALWRILDTQNRSWNVLPCALEVNESKPLQRATFAMTCRYPSNIATAGVPDPSGRELLDDSAPKRRLRRCLQQSLKLLLLCERESSPDGLLRCLPLWEACLEVDVRDTVPLHDPRVAAGPPCRDGAKPLLLPAQHRNRVPWCERPGPYAGPSSAPHAS
mmetsp:Transcript_20048/g.47137  ORF Transcript_20048/g.47137 Transcript_20048/m.47137 type:complete len:241 (-) Transcript_20048:38-760(-)